MINDVERTILSALSEDFRKHGPRLAETLGVSRSFISKKITELHAERGIIDHFTIAIDYGRLGYVAHAITMIKFENPSLASLDQAAKQISTIDEAIEIYTVFGEWDIYVRWLCRSNSDIMQNIYRVLDRKDIKNSLTVTFGKEYRREPGPTLSAEPYASDDAETVPLVAE